MDNLNAWHSATADALAGRAAEPRTTVVDVDEFLRRAESAIAAGERFMREAADYIAAAQAQGVSQRAIAARIGKSHPWVNRLLAWRAGGFLGEAFNRAARKSLQSAGQPADQETRPETATSGHEPPPRDGCTPADDDAVTEWWRRTNSERVRVNMFDFYGIRRLRHAEAKDRELLVKALGMLGSNQPGEVLNAARLVEKQRRKLNIAWETMIIPASPDPERDLVA